MTTKKIQTAARPLTPDTAYRLTELPAYYGVGISQIYDMIEKKEIPKLVKFRKHGRAVGHYGATILEHQKKLRGE
jgi:predicted DNA-binding transcriptional regulator AlpA